MNATSGTTRTTYTIGEFSQITGLSIKTLRFYHEKGILVPSSIDADSGYRFYDDTKVEKARVVMRLRRMECSIEDIAAVFAGCEDEANILEQLRRQKQFLQQRISEDRDVVRALNEIIDREEEAKQLLGCSVYAVRELALEPLLVAGIRIKGRYSECGEVFSRLGKALGRHICGKPFCLYYDGEYREDDASFEPCFPIRKPVAAEGISVRQLPGSKCLALVHRGPYDQLGRSYAKILKEARQREAKLTLPTREVYLKGPGLIFKGSPKNYLTEIQLPVGS